MPDLTETNTIDLNHYAVSLRDALPICLRSRRAPAPVPARRSARRASAQSYDGSVATPFVRIGRMRAARSEEHTSELQSPYDLVCRLLLEKKKIKKILDMVSVAAISKTF